MQGSQGLLGADAGQFIQTIENRQGLKVACLEEIACRKGWITPEKMVELATQLRNTSYGQYLFEVAYEILGKYQKLTILMK